MLQHWFVVKVYVKVSQQQGSDGMKTGLSFLGKPLEKSNEGQMACARLSVHSLTWTVSVKKQDDIQAFRWWSYSDWLSLVDSV